MTFVRSFGIRQKLAILGLVCLLGAFTLAGLAILFSGRVAETARVIDQERFAPVSKLQELTSHLKEVRFRLARVLLEQMPIPGTRNHLHETVATAPALWRDFRKAVASLDGETAKLVADIDADMPQFERFAAALDQAYASEDRK